MFSTKSAHCAGALATILLLASAFWLVSAEAASFDCTKARTEVEKLICVDDELSNLDEYLDRYYRGALAALGDAAQCLRTDQRAWLQDQRNACSDRACIRETLVTRLSELDALQPGANTLKDVNLPVRSSLMWIVPPALDEVAAPRGRSTKDFEVTGRIVNEIENGGDVVIVDDSGEAIPLVLLMLVDPSSLNQLAALSSNRAHRYRARGRLEVDEQGGAHFDPAACLFIHRLPREMK